MASQIFIYNKNNLINIVDNLSYYWFDENDETPIISIKERLDAFIKSLEGGTNFEPGTEYKINIVYNLCTISDEDIAYLKQTLENYIKSLNQDNYAGLVYIATNYGLDLVFEPTSEESCDVRIKPTNVPNYMLEFEIATDLVLVNTSVNRSTHVEIGNGGESLLAEFPTYHISFFQSNERVLCPFLSECGQDVLKRIMDSIS